MGMILESAGTKARGHIHGEARGESFVVYSDLGREFSVELYWDQIDDLSKVVSRLRRYAREQGKDMKPRKDLKYCGGGVYEDIPSRTSLTTSAKPTLNDKSDLLASIVDAKL